MTYFLQLSTEDDFLSLLARIWIVFHFPLESPIINFIQVIIQFVCRCIYVMCNREQACVICKYKYKALEQRAVATSLIKIKNNKVPIMDPWGVLTVTFAQLETCPFKTTF